MNINWGKIASSLLSIAQNVPGYVGAAATVIDEAETIYNEVKTNINTSDQATLDAAFTAAKAADRKATDDAGAALTDASKK